VTDAEALDAIARILRDPKWDIAMLEDIAELIERTGRCVETIPSDASTWIRH
jgi:Leu/Phe-tRNA-protein transferase